MGETFEQFMVRANEVLVEVCGMSADDMVDAPWYDLYEDYQDCSGEEFREAVLDTMSEADEGFAQLREML